MLWLSHVWAAKCRERSYRVAGCPLDLNVHEGDRNNRALGVYDRAQRQVKDGHLVLKLQDSATEVVYKDSTEVRMDWEF